MEQRVSNALPQTWQTCCSREPCDLSFMKISTMAYDSSSVRNLRDAMFAFNFVHPLRTIETLRVGM